MTGDPMVPDETMRQDTPNQSPAGRRGETMTSMFQRFAAIAGVMLLGACAAQPATTAKKPEHRLIVQVNENDPAKLNLALNNIANVYSYYMDKNEPVEVELVAYGPGLHIFRGDTSPVKARLETLRKTYDVTYSACGNTMQGMERAEGKAVSLVSEVRVVPAGVTRIMELQEQGWSYLKP
jgi:intracellular sulfur oxidation DsrE/DsrF family protein